MFFLPYSSESPSYNLALEELLLEPFIKQSDAPAILRVWKNNTKCVVIGRGEKIDQQVYLEQTQPHKIPVIRRVSGGGTVLHGPDNINLSFFLPYTQHPDLSNLKSSYQIILSWVQSAFQKSHDIQVEINGSCDLILDGKKFSGTAQARKRHGLLHHMTILLKADYDGMQAYLKEPEKRPDYRENRTHRDFVIGIQDQYPDFELDEFITALRQTTKANEDFYLSPNQIELCGNLEHKYLNQQWNHEGRYNS